MMIRCMKQSAVVASIATVAALIAPASAAPPIDVPIVNPSFEDPALADGAFALGGVPGWSDFDQFGPLDPPDFLLNQPVPEGENVAFSNLDADAAEQILDISLCVGDQLTLMVYVGARNDALTFGGYSVALEAVADDDSRVQFAIVTSNDGGALIPPAGGFVEITLTHTVADPALFGQRLAIRLGSFADGINTQTLFDDVRLSIQTNSIQVPICVPTIQEAIELADEGDEIVLQEGDYYEYIDFMGKNITLRGLDPNDGNNVQNTVIFPDNTRGFPGVFPSLVTFNSGEGPDARILGVTLINPFDAVEGGCILIDGASPIIDRCVLIAGHADTYGGGVSIKNGSPAFLGCDFQDVYAALGGGAMYIGSGAVVDVNGCEFYGCYADPGSGGSIYIDDGGSAEIFDCRFGYAEANDFGGNMFIDTRESVLITDSFFGDLRSGGRTGGAQATLGGHIFSLFSSPLIRFCIFGNGYAREGGSIYAYAGSPGLVGCDFYGNYAEGFGDCCLDDAEGAGGGADLRGLEGAGGGGAYAQLSGSASIARCSFTHNATNGNGGAISTLQTDLDTTECVFTENTAQSNNLGRGGSGDGGAVYAVRGFTNVSRSSFFNNFARFDGGGLYLDGGEVFLVRGGPPLPPTGNVVNCVFDGNSCEGFGGGATIRGAGVLVANSTFAHNESYDPFNPGQDPEYGGDGGGLYASPQDDFGAFDPFVVVNTIMWDNEPNQMAVDNFFGDAFLAHSCLEGGVPGFGVIDDGGNIAQYPRFSDINGGDNDPDTFDDNDLSLALNSPCIDAGDTPALTATDLSDLDNARNTRVLDDTGAVDTGIAQGARVVDMGAFEFQGTSDGRCNPADLADPRGLLNFDDVLAFLEAFANKGVDADLDVDFGVLDFTDVFAFLTFFGDGCP